MNEKRPKHVDDEIVRLLASKRRRAIIRALRDAENGYTTVRSLAEGMADSETDFERNLELVLYHADLPKLSRAGLIDFDPRTRMVRYRETGALADLLSVLEE